MKMRRQRVFLLCTVGLCVISFLHYYKALHYVSLLRELSAPYPNINSFILVTGFFWRERGAAEATPLSPEEAPPLPGLHQAHAKARGGGGGGGVGGQGGQGVIGSVGLRDEPAAPHPWKKPQDQGRAEDPLGPRTPGHPAHPARPARLDLPEVLLVGKENPENPVPENPDPVPDSLESMGDLHTRTHQLRDDPTPYFVRTKAGALCFRAGTEVLAAPKETSGRSAGERTAATGDTARRKPLQAQPQTSITPRAKTRTRGTGTGGGTGKRLVKCVCRPGWHGPYCGVPTMVFHSNLPTKERLVPRETPRRVINAINVNHEFDLLHVRFHELQDAVDVFLVCESNFTAYGEKRPLSFLRLLLNGTYDYVREKIVFLRLLLNGTYDYVREKIVFLRLLLNGTYDYVREKIVYVFLDHFPAGGRQDGWIADDYLRTFLTRNGLARLGDARHDDVFLINDADEIPAQQALVFLKLFNGWTEPFAIHMRKSLYGFFWKQFGSLEVVSGCTLGMLHAVYDGDGIKLRRREYYTLPGFRRYENATGHILVQWSLGSPFHFAGWHCSWCFTPAGIYRKLVSAQNGDFPRWGDYEDKRDLNYIRDLIRTGGWFDGSLQEYPPVDPTEHMYAPRYMLDNYERYRYLLENPYSKKEGGEGGVVAPAGGAGEG